MTDSVTELGVKLRAHKQDILREWRRRVLLLESAQTLDLPTLNDHIPVLIDDIAEAFIVHGSSRTHGKDVANSASLNDDKTQEAVKSAAAHGQDRHELGFDLAEVVAEYSSFRDVIFDFVIDHQIALSPAIIRSVNTVLDVAISRAVRAFAGLRAAELRQTQEKHLAFIAHDLRTPLNAISTCVALLSSPDIGENESVRASKIVPMLERNIQRIVALVEGILATASPSGDDVTPTTSAREMTVWPIVEQICLEVFPLASKQGAQIVNVVDADCVASIDMAMFTRVVQNLLGNAIKAVGEGTVTISSHRRPGAGKLAITFHNDNGVMPEAHQRRLTEASEADTEETGCVNRGLSIVRQFVQAMHGSVEVSSNQSRGTSVTIFLPDRAA